MRDKQGTGLFLATVTVRSELYIALWYTYGIARKYNGSLFDCGASSLFSARYRKLELTSQYMYRSYYSCDTGRCGIPEV